MKKLIVLSLIIVFVLSAFQLPPQLPSSFYGTVTGYPAGTKVNVWMNGARVAQTTTFDYPGYGTVYTVNVPGLTADEGKALTFKTGGVVIGRGMWHSGTNVELNLSKPATKAKALLYGVTDGGGNLLNTSNPQMSGYCSLAYPSRGVPCGVVILSTVSPTPTGMPATLSPTATETIVSVFSPTFTQSAIATRTATETPTFTPSPTPSFTPIPSTVTPSFTPTKCYSVNIGATPFPDFCP